MKLHKVEAFSDAAIAKLESSGLTVAQANTLGIYSVANALTLNESFDMQPALVLPYYGPDRKPLAAHASHPAFYRIRYLNGPVKGFDDASGKKQRYAQPPATRVCAYFPKITDWEILRDDPNQSLIITEGELKAAKATAEGFPTIGLGGVHSFRAASHGIFWLPELEAFRWANRRVTVCYDSDFNKNPAICTAINTMCVELEQRGALVEMGTIPDVYDDGRKTGLDDLLVERGDEGLFSVLAHAQPLFLTRELWAMNEELVYVRDPGIMIATSDGYKMTPAGFSNHSDWSTESVPGRHVTPTGDVSIAKVSAAPTWLKWPLRRAVDRITYKPGEETFMGDEYNEWSGWGCEPKKGDITPWKTLIGFIFAGAEPKFVDWFLDWCAYPLQYPGTKLFSAMVVFGDTTGTGKTLIGYTLGNIYGKNFTKIENKDLKRDFNGWAVNRQFILGDEISGSDKRAEADALKTVITQEEITINIKGLPTYVVPDCINYYFTSNHADAFFIEDKDRRYAVHEVLQDSPMADSFYREFDEWKNNGGPSALFHALLARDLSGFNPKAPAFKTAARSRMSMMGKSDLAVWCTELKDDPNSKLWLGQMRHQKDLFTSSELLTMYQQTNDPGGKVTPNGMARALAAAGFKQAHDGMPIIVDGKQQRYFVIRYAGKWNKVKNNREFTRNISLPPVREHD